MEKPYINNIQGICPVCGKSNLDWGDMELEGNHLYYEWICADCKTEGKEWYELKFDGHNVILPDGTEEIVNDFILPEE